MKCNVCGNFVSDHSSTCLVCGSTITTNLLLEFDDEEKNYRTRRKLYILCIIFLLIIIGGGLFLINPSAANLINNPPKKDYPGRTIMIYMVGSNLETELGLGSRDLSGINYDKISENGTHVLLMAGGTKSWYNQYINTNSTCIYELTANGYEVVEDKGLVSMGKADTLTSFLNYSYNKYKTGKYDLIIWDHGGAVDGSSYDDLFREGLGKDNLKLSELTNALSASPFKKNNKLETLLYRTCLNSTIETANAVKDYANYMIASEEITLGLSYGPSVLTFLNDINKETSYLDYGKNFIDGYKNIIQDYCAIYKSKLDCADITYSIIDLNEINNLNDKLNIYFENVNKNLSTTFTKVSKFRANSRQYAADMNERYDMVDLKELITDLSSIEENGATDVINAIDNVVKYNYSNDDVSAGISIYMPFSSKSYFVDVYENISMPKSYKKFVTDYYSLKNNYNTSFISLLDNESDFTKEENGNANIYMDLTDEEVSNYASSKYIIFADMGDNFYKPILASNDISLNGNRLGANVFGKMIKVCDDTVCYWLNANEYKKSDDTLILKATGTLSRYTSISDYKVDAVELYIQIDDENPDGKVISVNKILTNKDSLDIGNLRLKLEDYQTFTIATQYYTITDDQGNYTSDWKSNGIYRGQEFKVENLRFERKDFNDETRYVAVIGYVDVSGKTTWSNLIELK